MQNIFLFALIAILFLLLLFQFFDTNKKLFSLRRDVDECKKKNADASEKTGTQEEKK